MRMFISNKGRVHVRVKENVKEKGLLITAKHAQNGGEYGQVYWIFGIFPGK